MRILWIILLAGLLNSPSAAQETKEPTKGTKKTEEGTKKAQKSNDPKDASESKSAPATPLVKDTPSPSGAAPSGQSPTPAGPTNSDIAGYLLTTAVVVGALVVISACITCGILALRINKVPHGTPAQLQTGVAALPTLAQMQAPGGTLAELQTAIAALPTLAQMQAPGGTLAQLQTALQSVSADVARLGQEIALVKGSNDSVLNLVSHLVPGLPPQIASLEPPAAAAGAAVVILGNNFQSGAQVWFGTVAATVTASTNTSIRLSVPPGLSGDVNVYVQGQSGVSAPRRFTVTA